MNQIKENIYKLKDVQGIVLVSLLFLLVIFHHVFNHSFRHWDVSIVLICMFLFCVYKKKIVKPNLELVVFCASSFVLITLNYQFFGRYDLIPEALYRTYKYLINQYFWFLPLIALPTIYQFIGFKPKHLVNILNIVSIFLSGYLLYWGIALDFDRGNFAEYFNPVISYDITFIALSLLAMCFAFLQQGKLVYFHLVIRVC